MNQEDLWRSFPTTATEFEAMFPDEKACRRYLVEVRWGGRPRCGKCDHDRVWELRNGRFECRQCGHQTSVTAGTVLNCLGCYRVLNRVLGCHVPNCRIVSCRIVS